MSKKRNSEALIGKAAEYEIHLSQSAAVAYERYAQKALQAEARGDSTSQHITTLRQLDEAIESIIPRDPFNKRFALVGDLKEIYRLHKGRLRICWIGSSTRRRIYVIFISETLRKEGDKGDPYAVLSRRVAAGEFDAVLQSVGMKPRAKQLTNRVQ